MSYEDVNATISTLISTARAYTYQALPEPQHRASAEATTTMSATRPLYTPAQLHEVYDRIRLPSRFRYEPGAFSAEVVRHNDGHGFLAALMSHTLANIPFENLELHYSPHHQISIHPDALFQKIVRQGTGRGGYCMENNVFLGTVMRSLGYEV